MSLITLCNNAVADSSFAQVAQIFGNPDQTAVAMLGCARRAVRDFIRHNNGGWTVLTSEYDFQTNAVTIVGDTIIGSPVIINVPSTAGLQAGIFVYTGNLFPNNATITAVTTNQVTLDQNATAGGTAQTIIFGQAGYPLPSDFGHFIDSTMWDRSRFWKMRGPLTPQQWQLYKSSIFSRATLERRWRVKQPVHGTSGQTYFFLDPTPGDSNAALVFEYSSNSPILSNIGTPQTDWLADTDTCKLPEYLIELGVRWRMLKRFGYDYSTELDEYERAADVAAATDGGMDILDIAQPPNTWDVFDPATVGIGPIGGALPPAGGSSVTPLYDLTASGGSIGVPGGGRIFLHNSGGALLLVPPTPSEGLEVQVFDANGTAGSFPVSWQASVSGVSNPVILDVAYMSAVMQYHSGNWYRIR